MIIWLTFFYDNSMTLSHFGGAITKMIGLTTLTNFVLELVLLIILFAMRKNFSRTVLFLMIVTGLLINPVKNSCQGWRSGLFGKEL